RLSLIRAFWSSLHRLAPMLSPARLTTAPAPSSPPASIRPWAGSHRSASPPPPPRSMGTIRWPARSSAGRNAVPISPLDPVTTTSIRSSSAPAADSRPPLQCHTFLRVVRFLIERGGRQDVRYPDDGAKPDPS